MSSVGSPCSTSVICEEVFDDGYHPSNEEITDYALKIGINPTKEPHLLYLAREGLIQALPSDWKICYNDQLHAHYYYNAKTKATQWDHPLDAIYRELSEQARQKLITTPNSNIDISEDASQLDSGIKSFQGNDLELDSINNTNNEIPTASSTTLINNQNFKMNQGGGTTVNRILETRNVVGGSSGNLSTFGGLKPIKNSRFEVVRTSPQISLDMRINNSMVVNTNSTIKQQNETTISSSDKKGFQMSGMGSMFLKSNTRKDFNNDKEILTNVTDNDKTFPPTNFFVESLHHSVKGILRDSSLTDVRRKFDESNHDLIGNNHEDKKSVRFNLDDIKMRSNYSPDDDPSSSRRFTQSPEISDNSDDDPWDFMEEDDNIDIEKHVKQVKVTPVVPKIPNNAPVMKILNPLLKNTLELHVDSTKTITSPSIISSNSSCILLNTFGKPIMSTNTNSSLDKTNSAMLDKMKERNLVRPLYEDTDSDSRGSSVKSFIQKDEYTSLEFIDKNKIDLENLSREQENNLELLKLKYSKQMAVAEKKLREDMSKALEELKIKYLKENEIEITILQSQLKNNDEQVQEKSEEIRIELEKSFEDELTEMKRIHEAKITEIEKEYETQLKEIKENVEKENNGKLEEYRLSLEQQFNEKRNQITSDHKKTMNTLQKNHTEILQELERDLKSEEEILKKEHTTKLNNMKDKLSHELEMERTRMRETGEDRLYEKLRCEKRLLEDKYRCLKEKYVRLKTDVKLSLERRNRRREQQATQQQSLTNTTTTTTGSETERSTSNKPLIGNNDVKSVSLSASYPVEHGKPPTITAQKSHNLHVRERSGDRRKGGIASKYIKQLQAQYQDDTTSVSHSDTTISNNYTKGKYLPAPFIDNGNSDSEAFSNNPKDHQENNNYQRDRQRKKIFTRMKSASTSRLNTENFKADRPCTPVENLRRQLEKLEDLEDQFPDNSLDTTYHLRYPFSDISNDHAGTSSELEFFKHRIHLERDSVRRAKESLRTQRTNFRARQREIKLRHKQPKSRHTLDQLIQEEKELTEMEVNLHRTRALLGEKVIRLRHLEQSLQRIYEKDKPVDLLHVENKEDATLSDLSSHSSSGFSSTEFASDTNAHINRRRELYQDSSEAIRNLEILNVEIKEILDILNKQQNYDSTSLLSSDINWATAALLSPFSQPSHHNTSATATLLRAPQSIPTLADRLETYRQLATGRVQTSLAGGSILGGASTIVSQNAKAINYTTSLVERTRDLRNWLRQAKSEHEILLGGNITVIDGGVSGVGAIVDSHQANL